jgi:hypothetical protein
MRKISFSVSGILAVWGIIPAFDFQPFLALNFPSSIFLLLSLFRPRFKLSVFFFQTFSVSSPFNFLIRFRMHAGPGITGAVAVLDASGKRDGTHKSWVVPKETVGE